MTAELAAHLIRFITEPTSRTYVMNYPAEQRQRALCSVAGTVLFTMGTRIG